MPADSVHCYVTSPPYWGLRDYGTPPQVWGGDPDCRHRWGSERLIARSGGTAASTLGAEHWGHGVSAESIKRKVERSSVKASQGAFCQRCDAWRGSLGLEPTYQLYVDHLVTVLREVRRVLRPDGTLWLVIVKASAGPNTMCPALWTSTSMCPVSAMTLATAASTESWESTSSSTVRRSTPYACEKAATFATSAAFQPVVSRIEA
jgi:DNA modification methylase